MPNANDQSELILDQIDDGTTRIHVRLVDGSVWLTQRQLAELYQVSVPTVSEHLHNIFAEGELSPEATVRKFRTVRTEGNRTIAVLAPPIVLGLEPALGLIEHDDLHDALDIA